MASTLTLPLVLAAAVILVVMVSVGGSTELDRRLRAKRVICSGRLVEVDEFCRWNDLECACVTGTFCSTITHICEACQASSANCTSHCKYACLNGGRCDWATGRCLCPPEHSGADCGLTSGPPDPAPTEQRPAAGAPSICGERQCLNGGTCQGGTCVCPTGYYLPDCSLCLPHEHPRKCLDHCSLLCDHGDCLTEHQRCHCSVDYTGDDCSLCVPARAYANCTNYCSPMCRNGATCNTATRKCGCKSGWWGETCHQPCPRGTFGPNCLQQCRCPVGPCDPVTGQCLCEPDAVSQGKTDCKPPCDCLVKGVCHSKEDCPNGKTPETGPKLPATAQTIPSTTASEQLQNKKDQSTGDRPPSMMMLVIVTSIGVAVLLIVVVILIVCLVRSRQEKNRKPVQTEEAEKVPMTGVVAGTCNDYDDASSMPMSNGQPSTAPYRPSSGYEDVRDMHKNMPDLLPASGDISPYATTASVTVHAETASPQYTYVSIDELKTLKEDGKPADEGTYNKLEFLPTGRSIRRPVVAEGTYSTVQDDGTYEDASSGGSRGPLLDADSSGYAKMSPSTTTRKALSLKRPPGQDDRLRVQRKAASLNLPRKEAQGKPTPPGGKETYENAYVGFDPEGPSKDAPRKQAMGIHPPPPPPPPESIPQQQSAPASAPSSNHKPKGGIPQYAKPNKGKSQQSHKKEIPQYAKPNKPKSEVPQYAKPNQVCHADPASDRPYDQLERSHVGGKGKSTPDVGYAHLMDAVSPSPDNNIHVYDYPPQ